MMYQNSSLGLVSSAQITRGLVPSPFFFCNAKKIFSSFYFSVFLLLNSKIFSFFKYFPSLNIFLLFVLRFLLFRPKIFSFSEYYLPFPAPIFLCSTLNIFLLQIYPSCIFSVFSLPQKKTIVLLQILSFSFSVHECIAPTMYK